jgi:hypothetical protein
LFERVYEFEDAQVRRAHMKEWTKGGVLMYLPWRLDVRDWMNEAR